MEFKEGLEADFYGVDNNSFKLGETVFEAIEDEHDGYRSCLQELKIIADTTGLIFFHTPIARVRVERATQIYSEENAQAFEGHRLVDVEDGHEWLLVGTNNDDSYYPFFTFRYTPKESA